MGRVGEDWPSAKMLRERLVGESAVAIFCVGCLWRDGEYSVEKYLKSCSSTWETEMSRCCGCCVAGFRAVKEVLLSL